MTNILDLNKIGSYVFFNSNRKTATDLTSIKIMLEGIPNIEVDPKKKDIYYKKDFYEIVCKKIFNSINQMSGINSKFIFNTLRTVDALLLVETIDTIDNKFICGFATLHFSPDINIIQTQLVGFNSHVDGCRQFMINFLPTFCQNINMMHLSFGGLLLNICN